MLKTNIAGSVIISLMILSLIGYGFSIGVSLEWGFYLKLVFIVALIAALVSVLASWGNKKTSQ